METGQQRSANRWLPVISFGGVLTMLVGASRVLDATGDLGLTYTYIGSIFLATTALTIYVKRRR
jgi:hypothetical protein